MDGRDGMALSGAASFYISHRGIPGNIAGSQPGLHATAAPVMRALLNPGSSLTVPSSGVRPSAFQVESPAVVSSHGGGELGEGASQVEPAKKKRGRPRKYGPDGNVALALSPISSSAPSGTAIGSGSASGSGAASQKRGRGRPPGSGRKQQLALLGEWVVGSAGMGFTPHVITIAVGEVDHNNTSFRAYNPKLIIIESSSSVVGDQLLSAILYDNYYNSSKHSEDIATKIMSFSQQGPRSVCILSANGVVSTVTLRQPTTSGGTVTYEGRFEILSLSGSYMLTDKSGSRNRAGGLSISLSSPDGRVIGGGVAGVLIAATPVQVIVGSFIYAASKAKTKAKASNAPNADSEIQGGDDQSAEYTPITNQNLTSAVMGAWPSSAQLDMRNAHIEIDLMRG